MRVKIRGRWYDSKREIVIVELSSKDRQNIAEMHPEATRYGSAPDAQTEALERAIAKR